MALAILFTFLAGSATALGGLIGVLGPNRSRRILTTSMALSAGVMIYISLFELLPTALADSSRPSLVFLGFFGGSVLVLGLGRLADRRAAATGQEPEKAIEGVDDSAGAPGPDRQRLTRTGVTMAVVLAAHNAPEGFVTLLATLHDPVVAIPIVVAIALHNIPEGIAVAVPMYQATGSRLKSWALSAASGMAEPVGALVLFALIGPFLDTGLVGLVNAVIAGIMLFISLHELIPLALTAGRKTTVALWILLGMAVMAISMSMLG